MMKISIIIATYNSERTLRQLLESIKQQSYGALEVIVIDGGSTDNTLEILHEYESVISYKISEPDGGIYDALNKGIRISTGDYVYFIGSDDSLYDSNSIDNISRYMKDKPVIVCGNVVCVDEFSKYELVDHAKDRLKNIFDCQCMPHHQGMFMRSDVIKEFYFNQAYKVAADYDLFFRVIKKYGTDSVVCCDTLVAYFSMGKGTTYNIEMSTPEYVAIMKKNNISLGVVQAYQKNMYMLKRRKASFYQHLKKIIAQIGILGVIRKKQGWRRHHCMWSSCRWE